MPERLRDLRGRFTKANNPAPTSVPVQSSAALKRIDCSQPVRKQGLVASRIANFESLNVSNKP
jgi:hypothetical protein